MNENMEFIQQILNSWLIEYKIQRNLDYEWMEKDRKAIGLLLKRYKEKNPNSDSEQTLKDFATLFTKALRINTDEFLRTNMTLPFLNSQINKIKIIIGKEEEGWSRIKPLKVSDIKKIIPEVEDIFKGWSGSDKEFMKKTEEGQPLKKSEYVRKFGAKGFTESEYRKYLMTFASKTQEK